MKDRCYVRGSRAALQEPAVTFHGVKMVCDDGYACALRANGSGHLMLVEREKPPVT